MGALEGKVAIVTGGSTGIGRATALAVAREGAAVVIGDLDVLRGPEVVAEIEGVGGQATFVQTDVADADDVDRLVAMAVGTYGGVDLACNNAGIEGASAPLEDGSRADWDRTLAVNLTGVWLCMRAEIPAMRNRGGGSIVNIASIAGLVGFPSSAPYVATKHGVVGLTRTAALELATERVRVNAVCPGVIETEMIERVTHGDAMATAQLEAMEPVGHMGSPGDVAAAVVWLFGPSSPFVTGQAIAVDGGYVAR